PAQAAPAFEVVEDESDADVVEAILMPSAQATAKARVRAEVARSDQETEDEDDRPRKKSRKDEEEEDDEEEDDERSRKKCRAKDRTRAKNGGRKRGLVFGGIGLGIVAVVLAGVFIVRYVSDVIAFGGQWPEPRVPAGIVATGPGQSVTLHILGV